MNILVITINIDIYNKFSCIFRNKMYIGEKYVER